MKLSITKEEYIKHLDRIPKDLVDAYFDDATQTLIDTISDKYTLSDEQTRRLRENSAWVLIGFLHPDSLGELLVKDLGVGMSVATAIVGELTRELFLPHKKSITEVLLTYPPKKDILISSPTPIRSTLMRPIAPRVPVILSPQAKNLPPSVPAVQPSQLGKVEPPKEVQPSPTIRPIAPPPLQVARPLGSRPSILEVQRGTDGIRRAPQAPVGGYEQQVQNTNFQTPNGQLEEVGLPKEVRLPTNSPKEVQPSPHIMFKYVHPEPPMVAQISNDQLEEVGLPKEVRLQTPVVLSPRVGTAAQIPNQKIPDSRFQIPDSYEQDAFHKTQGEHNDALPVEHAVMDLEEYHITQGNPSTQPPPKASAGTAGSGNIVQSAHSTNSGQGNMLNLKE
ncbi:MAG: hypothetical protein AAB611_00115 [Patescibacteria group bacterium]